MSFAVGRGEHHNVHPSHIPFFLFVPGTWAGPTLRAFAPSLSVQPEG